MVQVVSRLVNPWLIRGNLGVKHVEAGKNLWEVRGRPTVDGKIKYPIPTQYQPNTQPKHQQRRRGAQPPN